MKEPREIPLILVDGEPEWDMDPYEKAAYTALLVRLSAESRLSREYHDRLLKAGGRLVLCVEGGCPR